MFGLFQRYRHVDYVMFENASIVDRFLNYWRRTGNQRLGIMYGRYEPHKDTPLGIKATVAAIYEPPQVSEIKLITVKNYHYHYVLINGFFSFDKLRCFMML